MLKNEPEERALVKKKKGQKKCPRVPLEPTPGQKNPLAKYRTLLSKIVLENKC